MEFDSLERKTLLSGLHPAMGHESHAAVTPYTPRQAIVIDTMRAIKARGFAPTKQVIAVPGGFTEYEISFMVRKTTVYIDITIPAPPSPGPGPTPG
jgi:hypothetical protein